MVKPGGEVFVEYVGQPVAYNVTAAEGGDAVSYLSQSTLANQLSGGLLKSYTARRVAGGWVTTTNDAHARGDNANAVAVMAFSNDLSKILASGTGATLVPGDTPLGPNLYVRDAITGRYEVVTTDATRGGPPNGYGTPVYVGASADFRHVIFTGASQIYEWVDGRVRVASLLIDGSATPGGADAGPVNAISNDGRRIYFTSLSDGQIFVREDGRQTKAVSLSQKVAPDPAPTGARFWAASIDGTMALFTSDDQLVDDDSDSVSDLYAYDAETERLQRLSGGVGANAVVGAADDASIIYFSYNGMIYARRDGILTPVGSGTATELAIGQTARTSADGTRLAFVSTDKLTEYDNANFPELYLYDAVTRALVCASCRTDGQPPSGAVVLPDGSFSARPGDDLRSYARSLSSDGHRLFFSSFDQLVAEDVNRSSDVYEYVDGDVRLLSGGRGRSNAFFLDASADGTDVFFSTRAPLLPSDQDDKVDIYDARIDGGFPTSRAAVECFGSDCQAASSFIPTILSPASVLPSGDGNEPDSPLRATLSVRPLSRSSLKSAGRSGVLRLMVRATVPGKVEADVFARLDGGTVVVGTGRRVVAASRDQVLEVRLSRRALQTLVRMQRLQLRVRVVHSAIAGHITLAAALHARAETRRPPSRSRRVRAANGERSR